MGVVWVSWVSGCLMVSWVSSVVYTLTPCVGLVYTFLPHIPPPHNLHCLMVVLQTKQRGRCHQMQHPWCEASIPKPPTCSCVWMCVDVHVCVWMVDKMHMANTNMTHKPLRKHHYATTPKVPSMVGGAVGLCHHRGIPVLSLPLCAQVAAQHAWTHNEQIVCVEFA